MIPRPIIPLRPRLQADVATSDGDDDEQHTRRIANSTTQMDTSQTPAGHAAGTGQYCMHDER